MAIITKYGTTLGYSTTSGGAYTTLATVKSIQPPTSTRGSAETTHLTSADQTRTFIGSWLDGGTASFVLLFDEAEYNTLYGTIFDAAANYFWKIVMQGAATIVFEGHVTSMQVDELNTDDDGVVTASLQIKVSGLPTFSTT